MWQGTPESAGEPDFYDEVEDIKAEVQLRRIEDATAGAAALAMGWPVTRPEALLHKERVALATSPTSPAVAASSQPSAAWRHNPLAEA